MKNSLSCQVDDDLILLERMMEELSKANEFYKPTNYWENYCKKFLPELRVKGLKNFRRRERSILNSFGATDIRIKGRIIVNKKFRGSNRVANILTNLINRSRLFSFGFNDFFWSDSSDIVEYFYYYVKSKFDKLGFDLNKAHTTFYGNPEDLIEINNNYWTTAHLLYCSMFADAARFIPFNNSMFFCELGAGLGRNIEILSRLYDKATFILIDIPPQLYVANQYLKKIYNEKVLDYEKSIYLNPLHKDTINKIKGKIVILPSWKLPEWSSLNLDIFWSKLE